MKCSTCGQEMKLLSVDTTISHKNSKYYKRTIYWCEEDDIWVTTEIPKDLD